ATSSGRPAELPGVEQMVGLFITTFPVIGACEPSAKVGEWLRHLQEQNLHSREHEHTPLYEIQQWAGASRAGLFDTLRVFENYPVDETLRMAAARALKFSHVQHQDPTHYPLAVVVSQGAKLTLRYSYRSEQVTGAVVERLAQQMRVLLKALTHSAQRCLGELDLLEPHERE